MVAAWMLQMNWCNKEGLRPSNSEIELIFLCFALRLLDVGRALDLR